MLVLVVDDTMIMRRNLKTILKDLGHTEVLEARTGMEAIELYDQFIPDLVTMDIAMPHMDGVSVVKELKDRDPNVKIIMVTARGQEDMVRQSIKCGAKGYILKPVSKDKLKSSIDKVFNGLNDTQGDKLVDN